MILALALCWASLSPTPAPTGLLLSRGAELPGRTFRYWAVEDSVLESKEADKNYGGALFLEAGPGRPVLIRFGDLNRAIGPGRRVTKASIKLVIGGGSAPVFRSASRVLAPWGEGPILTLAPMILAASGQSGVAEDVAAWSVTWRHRHAGLGASSWQVPGASGPSDSLSISSAKAAPAGENALRIEGLGDAIQYQLEHPLDNHGFLLRFDTSSQFFSSQAAGSRPELELQLEDSPLPGGADLSVVRIESTAAVERYAASEKSTAPQDGADVALPTSIPNFGSQHWPKDGETVTYRAHIRNVGVSPVNGFSARWIVAEKPGAAIDVSKPLAPGEETTVSTSAPFKNYPGDHRFLPIRVSIEQKTPDAHPENDTLEIQTNALSLKAIVAQSVVEALRKSGRGASLDEWMQAHFRFLNEVAFPQSRFSFAKNGILERVRLQDLAIVPDNQYEAEAVKAQSDLSVDGAILLGPGFVPTASDLSPEVLRRIGNAIGLIADFGSFGYPGAEQPWIKSTNGERPPEVSARDLFPGIMGFGDTRNEAMATPQAALPYGPHTDPMFSFIQMEHTDLFSATDAWALNSQVGKRRGLPPGWLYRAPGLLFLGAKDFGGAPLANAELTFYQLAAGRVSLETPAFSANTDASGLAILPKRPTGVQDAFSLPGGFTLKPTPFGRLSPDGGNGMFLVKATVNGSTDYAFLKLWHLLDTLSRNPLGPTILTVRFNISDTAIDQATQLAKGRVATDAGQSLPAQLSPLLDGDPMTPARVAPPKDENQKGWLEIDLGRDRAISEIDLITTGEPFWGAFDIAIYSTGQSSDEALTIAQEIDWGWSAANRSQAIPGSQARSVPYRFKTRRGRYVRINNRSAVGIATLAEIQIHPPKGP